MRRIYTLSLLSLVVLASCENKTGTGALVGTGAGALIGGVAGGGTGALIGAGAGAIGGALVGYMLDQSDRQNLQQQSPQTLQKIDQGQPLSINDVKAMNKAGIQDDVIISQIKSTRSVFHLNADQIIDLKNSGVSQKVIDYMIQTGNQ